MVATLALFSAALGISLVVLVFFTNLALVNRLLLTRYISIGRINRFILP